MKTISPDHFAQLDSILAAVGPVYSAGLVVVVCVAAAGIFATLAARF